MSLQIILFDIKILLYTGCILIYGYNVKSRSSQIVNLEKKKNNNCASGKNDKHLQYIHHSTVRAQ